MNTLFCLAQNIQKTFLRRKWQFCFIGGIALQRWGEPRLTVDVDISLLTGFGNEEFFIDILCEKFVSRIENPRDFALDNRVLLLKSEDNIPIDISLAGLPFEEEVIKRATDFFFLRKIALRTCSAEDMIIYKAFADRGKDWADIEGILLRQEKLDWQHVEENLSLLAELKESPHIMPRLQNLRNKC